MREDCHKQQTGLNKKTVYKKVAVISIVITVFAALCVVGLDRLHRAYRPYITSTYLMSSFSEEYIRDHTGHVVVDMDPVFELGLIAWALGRVNEPVDRSIHTNNTYYQRMIDYFREHKNHPFVRQVQALGQRYALDTMGMLFVYDIENGRVVHASEHKSSPHEVRLESLLLEAEDFIHTTDYLSFYESYRNDFQSKIDSYLDSVDLMDQWEWFEQSFPQRIDTYRIVTSPLMGSSHFTHQFYDREHGYREAVAFVPITLYDDAKSDDSYAGKILLTRMAFTEFGHHYVNPITDRLWNLMHTVDVFDPMVPWYDRPDGYDTPTLVFNEYMTWSIFNLYLFDRYDQSTYDTFMVDTVKVMEEARGFVAFAAFDQALLELYMKSDKKSIDRLYRPILRSMKKKTE